MLPFIFNSFKFKEGNSMNSMNLYTLHSLHAFTIIHSFIFQVCVEFDLWCCCKRWSNICGYHFKWFSINSSCCIMFIFSSWWSGTSVDGKTRRASWNFFLNHFNLVVIHISNHKDCYLWEAFWQFAWFCNQQTNYNYTTVNTFFVMCLFYNTF